MQMSSLFLAQSQHPEVSFDGQLSRPFADRFRKKTVGQKNNRMYRYMIPWANMLMISMTMKAVAD